MKRMYSPWRWKAYCYRIFIFQYQSFDLCFCHWSSLYCSECSTRTQKQNTWTTYGKSLTGSVPATSLKVNAADQIWWSTTENDAVNIRRRVSMYGMYRQIFGTVFCPCMSTWVRCKTIWNNFWLDRSHCREPRMYSAGVRYPAFALASCPRDQSIGLTSSSWEVVRRVCSLFYNGDPLVVILGWWWPDFLYS